MIVVDSSALVAILLQEPGAPAAAQALTEASARYVTSANWVETAIVMEARKGPSGAIEFDALMEEAGIEIVSVDAEIGSAARTAWRRFGKGRHPASLNYGDCFAYGLAKVRDLPLLAFGGDFEKTDLVMAIPAPGP